MFMVQADMSLSLIPRPNNFAHYRDIAEYVPEW
jgi:hypothetical protein